MQAYLNCAHDEFTIVQLNNYRHFKCRFQFFFHLNLN